ncbi:hypothetical protein NPIRD3C_0802 [Nitrosopumilus piranensis]|uniref:Uncharacterized protein n=1 Tax=Nitrosopumilus piranensis TaxID=1582439 RepID=A0A0C5BUX6_9ARCH|nr:hypothetical protein NPIRD3C_0802 [Nitrosopumilus piranensis]
MIWESLTAKTNVFYLKLFLNTKPTNLVGVFVGTVITILRKNFYDVLVVIHVFATQLELTNEE